MKIHWINQCIFQTLLEAPLNLNIELSRRLRCNFALVDPRIIEVFLKAKRPWKRPPKFNQNQAEISMRLKRSLIIVNTFIALAEGVPSNLILLMLC